MKRWLSSKNASAWRRASISLTLNLARVYSLEGDRDKARAVLQELLKQHPGHPQAQQALDELR